MKLNAQEFKLRKWATFHAVDKMKFSTSFMKEMSKQLKNKLEGNLNFENFVDEIDFSLNVGKIDTNLILINDTVTLKVELTNSFDKNWKVSCKWSSKDFKNPLDIHQSEIESKNVVFHWCSDLPLVEFKRIINSKLEIQSELRKKFKFDLDIYMNIYPPESCQFIFIKPPTKKELKEINTFFKNYQKLNRTFLYGDLTNYIDDPRYLTTLHFQVNEWNKEKFPETILNFFESFSREISNENILKIIVRH